MILPITGIRSVKNARLLFRQPDLIDERPGQYLLIWRDIPHWMVVDAEFYAFLKKFEQAAGVKDVIQQNKEWEQSFNSFAGTLKQLIRLSILEDQDKGKRRRKKKARAEQFKIENVALNITGKCNLQCRLCYNSPETGRRENELSAAEIIDFLKSIKADLARKPALTILGGEPLLQRQKLLEVARYAAWRGFSVLTSTNGTLIDEEFAAQAAQAKLQVQISLDGHNAALNDPLRGKGTFERIINGIKILTRHKVYTILSLVCHRGNLEQLAEFYALALQLKVDEARFIPLKNMGAAKINGIEGVSSKEIIIKAAEMFNKHPEYLKLAGRSAFLISAAVCAFSNKRPSCGTGLQTLLLDADGTVYPCLNLKTATYSLANIRNSDFDFKKMWNSTALDEAVRQPTSVAGMNKVCSECAVKYWCLGGCRGETYANKGIINAPAFDCADSKAGLLEMFWTLSCNDAILRRIRKLY